MIATVQGVFFLQFNSSCLVEVIRQYTNKEESPWKLKSRAHDTFTVTTLKE